MNVPPKEFIRVPVEVLTPFIRRLYEKVGLSGEDAQTLADLLVLTDLRGVFSHGTQQTASYVDLYRTRRINPRPRVTVVREGPTTAVIDGDGGLGHFPSLLAARMATAKAKTHGLGACTTRNHNHFGGAGKYSRIPAEAGCVGLATSSHIFPVDPKTARVTYVAGGSPISFAFPHRDEPPLVIDMATWFVHETDEMIQQFPAAIFKGLGMGATCAGLGKILAGVTDLHKTRKHLYPGANQGAFILAIDVERFVPREAFLRDMDEYVRLARSLKPLPGYDRADLPGNLEWEREREWRRTGIPLGPDHLALLEGVARKLRVPTPFGKSRVVKPKAKRARS
ncbi:MAG: Ldh family oxidoreductase [Planctomycetes bacterium]|nr:Ldh family oxidoreductase [Planctomycetota bacterium]